MSYELDRESSQLRAPSPGFDDAVRAIARTSHDVDRALTLVYRDPEVARSQIRDMAVATDPAQVEMLLRREPQRFGALRIVEEFRDFGLTFAQDDSKARASSRASGLPLRDLAHLGGWNASRLTKRRSAWR